MTTPHVELAQGAEENGLAMMLADLVRQNLEAKPHKMRDFRALHGAVSIVAEDADVALTLRFERRGGESWLTIHDGIVGIPDVTIRGPSETILAMSNLPLSSRLSRRIQLPLPSRSDVGANKALREMVSAMRDGRLHVYGAAFHAPMMLRLTRVMSVNG